MNLHRIVRGAINSVNPDEPVTIRLSAGYTTSPSGKRTPAYEPAVIVPAQVQPVQGEALRLVEGLGVQGERQTLYLGQKVSAIVRDAMKGGDMVTLGDGTEWLVTVVSERWPDWTAAIITRQISE